MFLLLDEIGLSSQFKRLYGIFDVSVTIANNSTANYTILDLIDLNMGDLLKIYQNRRV